MSHLTRFATLTGYTLHGNIAYGRTNGIYFNAAFEPESDTVTVRAYIRPIESLTFRDTGRGRGIDLKRINEYLHVRRREFPNNGAQADEQSAWTVLNNVHALKAEKISRFLEEFSRFLSDSGYVSSCAMCPETRKLRHTLHESQVLELCGKCHGKLAPTSPAAVLDREYAGTYLRGVAGAVLGGVLGIIPWLLLNFAGYIASVSSLLMAYFAYKGYRLMHGKRSRGMLPIIIAVLTVFTYIAVMVCVGISEFNYWSQRGHDVHLQSEIIRMMTALLHPDEYDTSLLWLRLGVGWLFAGIGSFGLLLRYRRETTGKDIKMPRIGHGK